MESLINNPGFDNITKKIFLLLDHETLLTCRLVCKSFKTKVEDPYCWIKRCSQLGQPKSLTDLWTERYKDIKVEAKNCQDGKTFWQLEQKFVLCLINWTLNFPLLAHLELGGFVPLHAAALFGCLEVVEFITSYTENVNHSWMLTGCTPLHLAARAGHTNVVEILASKMENLDIKDNFGHTPLHMAAIKGHAKIVEFLVSKVHNPNLIDNIGLSPYDVAVREGKFDIVEILHPYNNYWPTIPLQLPFLGSVDFPSIMLLPILLILKCI